MNLKLTILIFLLCNALVALAQQGLVMPLPEQDSAQIKLERQIEYRQLVSGNPAGYFAQEKVELPAFDFKKEIAQRYAFSFNMGSLGGMPVTGLSMGSMYGFFPGFYQNGMVLSEGAYKVGDKFTFGGFSYGANSMMAAPLPNQGMDKFDTYGSTLFLQYKVSKNFKIETRVNVSQGGIHPGF